MVRFTESLKAWGTPRFADVLKREIGEAGPDSLPLQQGLSGGSVVVEGNFAVMVIDASDMGSLIRVRAGIFYAGIVAGCSCADDPTPVDENNEYCEVQLDIDKQTAETMVSLLAD